jgi:putative membrane protein
MTAIGPKLAFLNALLNGTSAVLLLLGWRAIRGGEREQHRRLMVSAFAVSTLFLISYLIRVLLTGTHRYPGEGIWKAIYLVILSTHMLAAVAVPPLAVAALWLAWKGRFAVHKKVVRYAWPVWMYVSVTGVLVYVLLYHPPS